MSTSFDKIPTTNDRKVLDAPEKFRKKKKKRLLERIAPVGPLKTVTMKIYPVMIHTFDFP